MKTYQSRERQRWPVHTTHTKSFQNNFVERCVRTASQKAIELQINEKHIRFHDSL